MKLQTNMDEEKVQEMEKELELLRPLKDSSVKAQEEFKAKEEAWQKEKTDLESQINPNWKKTREQMDLMKAALKEKGIETDADGNVVKNPQHLDVNQIIETSKKAAREELLGNHLQSKLSEYDEQSGKLVKHFFDKLANGENITLQNMDKFLKQAHLAAEAESGSEIKKTTKVMQFNGGVGPRTVDETKIDEAKRQELGQLMGLTFASKKSTNK